MNSLVISETEPETLNDATYMVIDHVLEGISKVRQDSGENFAAIVLTPTSEAVIALGKDFPASTLSAKLTYLLCRSALETSLRTLTAGNAEATAERDAHMLALFVESAKDAVLRAITDAQKEELPNMFDLSKFLFS